MSRASLCLFFLWLPGPISLAACGASSRPPGADGDIDGDADVDGDSDSDADSDGDTDVDGDADGDADTEPDIPALLAAYCTMEAGCIPWCLCHGGERCACEAPERQAECADDGPSWGVLRQGEECSTPFLAWLACITTASCDEVEEFFRAHPDGVTETTPCGPEFHAMGPCLDFEPLTEYNFE